MEVSNAVRFVWLGFSMEKHTHVPGKNHTHIGTLTKQKNNKMLIALLCSCSHHVRGLWCTPSQEMEELFRYFDRDGDGTVSLEEFFRSIKVTALDLP